MKREVLPEWLDILPPQDPAALRSRRDLRRLNAIMRHPQIMSGVLRAEFPRGAAAPLVELGAGDGQFLLAVARRLKDQWPDTPVVLVDRLLAADPMRDQAFRALGWPATGASADAAEWLRTARSNADRIILSNLFFHQFETQSLRELLRLAAEASRLVVAVEPRRAWLPRLAGQFLWAVGCGPVTRHDAAISIRAGFSGNELSALWPDPQNWVLTERPAGLFSHLFVARRKD